MRQNPLRLRHFVFLGAVALAAPAQASGPAAQVAARPGAEMSQAATANRVPLSTLIHGELLAALQAIASQNQCISYTYDHNGNITSKVEQAVGSAPTWGSTAFGCFIWTSP